jgi:hypothetical protein
MMFERDTILRDLRKYVIEVTFTKVNGENRVMRCTLRPELLPSRYATQDITEETKFHEQNPDVISAWDIQKGGWRSFRIDSVSYVQNVDEAY